MEIKFCPLPHILIYQNHCYLIPFAKGPWKHICLGILSTSAAAGSLYSWALRCTGIGSSRGPRKSGIPLNIRPTPMPHLLRQEGNRAKVYQGKKGIPFPSPYRISFLRWGLAAITVFPDDRNMALDLLFSFSRLRKRLGAISSGSGGRS